VSAGRRAARALADSGAQQARAGEAPASPAASRPPPGSARIDGWTELLRHPLIRAGFYAWAVVGVLACAVVLLYVVAQLRLVVVPVVLALFPAALLVPLTRRLQERGMPGALAALLVLLGGLTILGVVGQFIVTRVIAEWPRLEDSIVQGWEDLQAFLATGPLGIDPTWIRDGLAAVQQQVVQADIIRTGVLGVASAVAEIVAMLVLLLVVLFFYLKDGPRIARWLRDLFPRTVREDVEAMGTRAWTTIAGYIRGQLLVALVDGVFIGVGIWILGVPLALPLGVLVFFGGLFPIVGAVVTGAIAVLVALADGGPLIALIALGIVIAVQQLESNVLAPMVLGKATALHPLAVLTSLTAGGILLGVLGAFIAVPIAASITRAIGYLRARAAPAV
jgi:putative heme transporter